ncbi:isochorismatase family protein [Nocardia sp. BMG51109]|uniref:isochorismatase family protein n=1 Tax=Nocardia sp. BMG51109 TaxID=1056816 RepID=UPI001E3C1DEC|nr:isochorismatase family protein [Nocardia sp. BMG51109]
MPTTDGLPANTLSGPVHPSRAALLIHDMQNHFLAPFERDRSPLTELLTNIGRLRNLCHTVGIPVVYSTQPGGQSARERGLLREMWGNGIAGDGIGDRIVEDLTPRPGDICLTKYRYSAFFGTDLHEQLIRAGRDQLIICGIYAHIGCLATACDAFMRDIRPFMVSDAVADFDAEHHHTALCWAAKRCAVVESTATVLGALQAATDNVPPTEPEHSTRTAAEPTGEPNHSHGRDRPLNIEAVDSLHVATQRPH